MNILDKLQIDHGIKPGEKFRVPAWGNKKWLITGNTLILEDEYPPMHNNDSLLIRLLTDNLEIVPDVYVPKLNQTVWVATVFGHCGHSAQWDMDTSLFSLLMLDNGLLYPDMQGSIQMGQLKAHKLRSNLFDKYYKD